MKIPFSDPWIDEEEARAVYETVRSKMLRYGKNVSEFERVFSSWLGVKHAIACSSGTAALHAVLLALGVGPGDEVIVPSFSCGPPAVAVVLCGAKPVFADIELDTLNLDPSDVRRKITSRTRAIIPIHYGGHPAELDELLDIAERHGIYLIEDCAEAQGALYRGRKVGTFGHVAIFAFSPNKIITTGEGGMVVTNDDEIAEKVRIVCNYGQKGRFNYVMLGNNYHMTEMQAAIGLVQMKKIDKIIELRRRIAKMYDEYLSKIDHVKTPVELPHCRHVYMTYYIRVRPDIRDRLIKFLEDHGVETRIYFPPLHIQPIFKKYVDYSLERSEQAYREIINIPIYPHMKDEEVMYVCEVIMNFFKKI